MESPERRRAGRLVWLAIGALVVGIPIFVAVRGLAGRRPAARARAALFGGAPSHGRAAPTAVRTQVAPASDVARRNAVTEPGRVAAAPSEATARQSSSRPVDGPSPSTLAPAAAPSPPVPDAAPSPAGPEQDLAHLTLWSATFAGGRALARIAEAPDASSAPPRARTLAAILGRALSRGNLEPAPDARTSVSGMRAQRLAGEASAALWLLAPAEGWGEPIERARVTIRDLEPGRWRVTWLDDVTGAELASEERDVESAAVLYVPTFARHLAAILERADAP